MVIAMEQWQQNIHVPKSGSFFAFPSGNIMGGIRVRVTVVTVEACGWRYWILPAPEILRMSNLRCFSAVTAAKRVPVTLERVTVESKTSTHRILLSLLSPEAIYSSSSMRHP